MEFPQRLPDLTLWCPMVSGKRVTYANVCDVFGQKTVFSYRKQEVGSLANLDPARKLGTERILVVMDDEALLHFLPQTQEQGSIFEKDYPALDGAWAEVGERQDDILRSLGKRSAQDPPNAE